MSFWGIIRLAFISLGRNKLRSLLTALGIIIGVMSVVAMVALGQGAYNSVQANISSMGTNLIIIMPGSINSRGMKGARGGKQTLLPSDVIAISQYCPSVGPVTPVVFTGGQAVFNNKNWQGTTMGVNEKYLSIASREISEGRFFSHSDISAGRKVCVIGETVAESLFGAFNPIGQTIRFNKMPLAVIGILNARGESSMGNDQDDFILAPFSVVQRRLRKITYVQQIYLSARTSDSVDAAKEEITELLLRRHRIRAGEEADFSIHTQDDMAEMAGNTMNTISLFLGSVASISLLIGGIGIMNIMLVSVTERTREIGIRMAIGAKTTDILYQFLVESVVLSCSGGIAGILGGIGLSAIIGHFVEFEPQVSNVAVMVSLSFSVFVGVFFGLYPAWKASQLNPIEAFRYE